MNERVNHKAPVSFKQETKTTFKILLNFSFLIQKALQLRDPKLEKFSRSLKMVLIDKVTIINHNGETFGTKKAK